MAVHDFDFALRHAAINDANWTGFRLAWPGLAGYERKGLPTVPYSHRWTWETSATEPGVGAGSWLDQVWRVYVLVTPGLPNIEGVQPQPYGGGVMSNDPALMLGWLRGYRDLPAMELSDVDGAIYIVRLYGYEERLLESYDAAHDAGGSYVVIVEFVETVV